MFAALYGEFAPFPGHDPELDAYALFHQRSLAMGWLDERVGGSREGGTAGVWAMNDAGWDHPLAAAGAGLVAWFQVEVSAVAADRPLPVRAFLQGAGDVVARAGRFELSAVHVLLPVQGLDPSARPANAPVPSLRTRGWFGGGAAHAVTAEVRVSGRSDMGSGITAAQLADDVGALDQSVFVPDVAGVTGAAAAIRPPFDDSFRGGPPTYGATLHGRMAEWSCDAVGWVGETLADLLARRGARSPVLLTVVRQGTMGTPTP